MRLPAVIAAVVLSLLTGVAGITLAAAPSTVSHQGATPAPGQLCALEAMTPGATWLMPAYDAEIADDSSDESQYRCLVPPSGDVGSHEHSGWFYLYVESGTITFAVEEGIMWTTGEATLLPGTSVTLNVGDWVLQDRTTTHAFSNVGTGEAILLTASGNSPLNGDGACRGGC